VLVVTPLFTNEATPFLRWNTGDVVRWWPGGDGGGSEFDVFARIRHAHRTLGFFKVRGININHAEFEDFMFAQGRVRDFRVEALARDGTDVLRIEVEFARGTDAGAAPELAAAVKTTFELTPDIAVLPAGTLAKEFEASVKTPRFADKR
jgi:phenylacetate-CoA ligase